MPDALWYNGFLFHYFMPVVRSAFSKNSPPEWKAYFVSKFIPLDIEKMNLFMFINQLNNSIITLRFY